MPRLRLGWQFTRAVDGPSFFLPWCIYHFSPKIPHSRFGVGNESDTFCQSMAKTIFLYKARKVRTVRPAGEKQPTHFTLLVEKVSICTTGVSKESLRLHICHPRLRLGRQLYAI